MYRANSNNDLSLARQASDWVVRCDRGLSVAEKQALEEWESADPRHRVELERIRSAWNQLEEIRAVPELNVLAEEIAARARVRRGRRRGQMLSWTVLGAAAAVAIGVISWQRTTGMAPSPLALNSENVKVLDSTARRVALPDGSTAELNGSSRIEVEFTPTERRVRLLEGEAHFVVAKHAERPFFVTAGPVTVRAVGTAFNVRFAQIAIEVLVTEGKVELEHRNTGASRFTPSFGTAPNEASETPPPDGLVAGQRAVIDHAVSGGVSTLAIDDVSLAEMEEVLGWQTTRLVFNNTPLTEVVARFNHFNRHQLTIGDPKLRDRVLTGAFRADNLAGFTRLLKASLDVNAELRSPNETVLLPMQ